MYAVEFETASRDGIINIPEEYKDKIGNMDNIRLTESKKTSVQLLTSWSI